MLEQLKQQVCLANLELVKRNLVILMWGNVSAFDPKTNVVVIKPSGVPYEKLSADQMVVVDLNGKIIEGDLNPSCDTPTHLELYRQFPELKGIVHTHSTFATSFAQAGQPIIPYGTTHADYFHHEIMCTRQLTSKEINHDYEINTGKVIIETLSKQNLNEHRGILVKGHGVFAWGKDPIDAVNNAQAIETIAQMAYLTTQIAPGTPSLNDYILDKHYDRKHGPGAYYGQKGV